MTLGRQVTKEGIGEGTTGEEVVVEVFIEISVPVRWRRRDGLSEGGGFFYDARRGRGKERGREGGWKED